MRPAPFTIEQLATFSREHIESCDIDPIYPVLKYLLAMDSDGDVDSDAALWRTFIYLAYYNIASSETALPMLQPDGAGWPETVLRLPTATERRGLRGGEPMATHLRSLLYEAADAGSLHDWLWGAVATSPPGASDVMAEMTRLRNWDKLGPIIEAVHGNGRWAAYKAREVLWKVNGLPLTAPDTGMANSTGPRDGLALFMPEAAEIRGNTAWHVEQLEDMAWDLRHTLADDHGLSMGIEELETCLCDFLSMSKGRFYVGHDTDHMLEQALHPSVSPVARDRILAARYDQLPHEYLGELHGRTGVDKARNRVFADSGVILARG